jgi:hypothetical protein
VFAVFLWVDAAFSSGLLAFLSLDFRVLPTIPRPGSPQGIAILSLSLVTATTVPCRSCRVRLLITYTGPDLRTFPHSPTRPRDAPPRPGTDTRLTAPPRPRPDVETDGAVPVGVCRFLLFFSSVQFSSGRLPRGALPRKGVGAEARVAVLVVAGVVVTVEATPSRARPRAPRWRSRRHRAPRTLPRPCSNRRRGCTRAAHLVRGRD